MFKRPVRHKFGAIKCERNGIKFPSKLERACYDLLLILQKRGDIRMFLRQVAFDIPGSAKHVVDFGVFTEESVLFIEAKGRDLPMGKLKRKQVEELFDIDVHVAKTPSELKTIVETFG